MILSKDQIRDEQERDKKLLEDESVRMFKEFEKPKKSRIMEKKIGEDHIEALLEDVIVDDESREKFLQWLKAENAEAALEIGFEHNKREENSEIPQCVLDETFGRGFLCALRLMEEKLKGE